MYKPISKNLKSLQHIHFPGITSFQHGLNIQDLLMDQHLAQNALMSKIRRNPIKIDQSELKPIPPTVLTFQFENVYVSGLKSKNQISERDIQNFKSLNSKFFQLNRGGQLTWHGKGQLVTYLILNLKDFTKLSPKCYVNNILLKPLQKVLESKFELSSQFDDLNPGIFINQNKIASIGVRIRHGITEYGTSLNINPDLKYLNTFELCGLKNGKQTSIDENLNNGKADSNKDLNIETIADSYVEQIAKVLNLPDIEKVIL
ncbi:uncharacterized protein KGF55_004114 [Candida pseudojiufengensis]|uniref:uncharacterized protein n=1 Tax=Candida pseudojiufengensis TaxID=497109 RepID=UPI002225B63E|nr:uncharacterized protein KGF55_004114 [Candida pseudojiufengensis]KAI5961189.1 hypothetical protein KGF55_004114 [Candida pseudojiufengensis]